jgi:uncharacterized damage-inducible protein DinB
MIQGIPFGSTAIRTASINRGSPSDFGQCERLVRPFYYKAKKWRCRPDRSQKKTPEARTGTPANRATSESTALLLFLLDQAYEKKAWHGPNLRGSLRRVSAREASRRAPGSRHTIAEIAVHAAYWKYAVRRRLRGEKRGTFALEGSNWFTHPDRLTDADWSSYLKLLSIEHQQLTSAVAGMPPARLQQTPLGGKISFLALITGIAAHDIYHAGQVQVLKRAIRRGSG